MQGICKVWSAHTLKSCSVRRGCAVRIFFVERDDGKDTSSRETERDSYDAGKSPSRAR